MAHLTAGPFSLCTASYPANLVQPRHAHAESSITMILAGSLEERVTRTHEYAHALSVVVKPGDTEHHNVFGNAGARSLQINLGRNAHPDTQRALGEWRWHHRGPVVAAALKVLQHFRARDTDALEAAVFDLIASTQLSAASTQTPPRWLLQTCANIDAQLPGCVRVSDVATEASVHPVYLARQFRRYFGCSVSEYIAARRLQRAAGLIATPDVTLSGAAFRAGYADQSHLTRAFRAGTGLTPRGFRHAEIGEV